MQSHRSRLVWPLIVFVHSPCELSSVQSERTARGPLTSSRESRRTEYWTPFSLNLHSSLFCQLHQLLTTLWHGVELAYRHTHSLTQTMQMYIGRGPVKCHWWINTLFFMQTLALVYVYIPKLKLCSLILHTQILKWNIRNIIIISIVGWQYCSK